MGRFKPKQRVSIVDAERLGKDNAEQVAQWCGGLLVTEQDPRDPSITFVGINVPTQLGIQRASQGDWIVKGTNGAFWPIHDDGFHDTYEPADA